MTTAKLLNQKADGGHYIPGLGVTARDITYIPSASIDENTLSLLEEGTTSASTPISPGST